MAPTVRGSEQKVDFLELFLEDRQNLALVSKTRFYLHSPSRYDQIVDFQILDFRGDRGRFDPDLLNDMLLKPCTRLRTRSGVQDRCNSFKLVFPSFGT